MIFYDTNSLIHQSKFAFTTDEPFLISSITLKELEHIKTSAHYDPELKYKVRKVIRLLTEYEDKYQVIPFWYEYELDKFEYLDHNNDSRIIITAAYWSQEMDMDIVFVTQDLACYHLAKLLTFDFNHFFVQYPKDNEQHDYSGFKEIVCNEKELNDFYSNLINKTYNPYNILLNEYLIIKDNSGEVVDQYKYTEDGFKQISYSMIESRMFGKTKPKDIYQKLAIDSMKKNKITMLRGAAGTGKSYLALGYLFEKLERHEIDKIIIFCNTVATMGSAKLGYLPGSRDEKLLDSQIGNFLSSKLGDKMMVESMIDEGTLVLLPMSDIRGYDTSGMHAGIYITEAQNLDIELMRLALQRIGDDSICILDGDSDAQVDLPSYAGHNNGMRRVSEVFRGDPCYGEITLQNIYRSRIARLAQQL